MMINPSPTEILDQLAVSLKIRDIAGVVLDDERFKVWSGSSKSYFHHYGKGGLAQHTLEVVDLVFMTATTLRLKADNRELYLSCLFHDAGKMYDYLPEDDTFEKWKDADHKRLIYHITRSGIIWHDACEKFKEKYGHLHDAVLHNILAHHGQREWGSPVAPKSQTAWLLHLCDGLSARMNDCNKLDVIEKK